MSAPKHTLPVDLALARIEKATGRNLGGKRLGVELIKASDIDPKPIPWVWPYWLASHSLHVLAGAPGTGKTTLLLSMCDIVSRGGMWPDGSQATQGDVVYWSGEDDAETVLVPRLEAMGAHMDRIHIVGAMHEPDRTRAFDPASDFPHLVEAIKRLPRRADLLVIDPIVSAVSGSGHKNAETRRSLQPLVDLAAEHQCAVVGNSHFTKFTKGCDVLDRVTGSLAFGAVPRLVLVTTKLDEKYGGGQAICRAKSNLGPDGDGFRYEVEPTTLVHHPSIETTRLVWGEQIVGDAQEIFDMAEARMSEENQSASDKAKSWLEEVLADGGVQATKMEELAIEAGHAWRTVQRVASRMGVKKKRDGYGPGSTVHWELGS